MGECASDAWQEENEKGFDRMTPSKKKAIVALMPGFKIDVISNS